MFRHKLSCHCPELNPVSSVIYRSLVTIPTELPKLLFVYLFIYLFICDIFGIQDSIFCILTRSLIRRSEIRFPARKRDFSLFNIVQTECGAHKTAYLTGTGDWQTSQGVKITNYLHLVLRVRMSEVVLFCKCLHVVSIDSFTLTFYVFTVYVTILSDHAIVQGDILRSEAIFKFHQSLCKI